MSDKRIEIDSEFLDLLRPLSTDEFRALEQSIKKDGCREPLITWGGVLIDGHNRKEICEKHRIQYETQAAPDHLQTRGDVVQWIVRNQLARRNLTEAERAQYALKLEDGYKAEAKANQGRRNDISAPGRRGESKSATARAAKDAGVSPRTVQRYKAIQKEGSEKLKEDVRTGKKKIKPAYEEMKGKASEPEAAPKKPPKPKDGRLINQKAKSITCGVISRLSEIKTNDIEKVDAIKMLIDWASKMRLSKAARAELRAYFNEKILRK